ncbi:MAG TPA: hypothetical protein EYG03_12645 [Planctomycetes bacterium]|nr:hypothetical protein [Planctomycetota bacterium]
MRYTLARWEIALLLLALGCQPAAALDGSDQPVRSPKSQTASADTDSTEQPEGNEQLPAGWGETSVIDVDPLKASQIGEKLGGRISRLKNVVYSVNGERFQLNTICCPDEADGLGESQRAMETAQHWDRLAKNQPAEIAMLQISEVQEAPAFNGRRSFLALRGKGVEKSTRIGLGEVVVLQSRRLRVWIGSSLNPYGKSPLE